MVENQNTEWKETWRDEYLKWICGFANVQGGKLYIGTEDDGTVIGIKDSKKLMEDIPNKIQSKFGIMADVNLLTEGNLEYIEIDVKSWVFPVNYNREYHYRSGSTKQQLTGNALTIQESFDIFRREAMRSGRMTKEDLNILNEELLDKLSLLKDGKLKRAGVLCFYRYPEKLISGCYVKIGKFAGGDILYQDEVHGSLLVIADKVIDLIYLKYLKAAVSY